MVPLRECEISRLAVTKTNHAKLCMKFIGHLVEGLGNRNTKLRRNVISNIHDSAARKKRGEKGYETQKHSHNRHDSNARQ